MMDEEFEFILPGMSEGTVQEKALELAVKAWVGNDPSDGYRIVILARSFEDYINEGYEDESEADIISLKEV